MQMDKNACMVHSFLAWLGKDVYCHIHSFDILVQVSDVAYVQEGVSPPRVSFCSIFEGPAFFLKVVSFILPEYGDVVFCASGMQVFPTESGRRHLFSVKIGG